MQKMKIDYVHCPMRKFWGPLHINGSVDNVENYKGITLLSTLSKLFTKMLNERLNLWADSNRVYIVAQSGFRSNLGTVDGSFFFT